MKKEKQSISCSMARKLDMVAYLSGLDIEPKKIRGGDYWYLSPFRIEKTPSFKVNRIRNLWYDFGEGCGGNLIDFGIRYFKCTVADFLSLLSLNVPHHHNTVSFPQQEEATIKIVKVQSLYAYPLYNYLQKRLISKELANQYCKEIRYRYKNKEYYTIGFPNDAGGWELRNPYFKMAVTPKAVSTFLQGRNYLCVFEGFMDFLSFLELLPNAFSSYDFLVLNSLSFFEKERIRMETYKEVWLFFDRDHSGISKTALAKSWDNCYVDKSYLYLNHKDLNDGLGTLLEDQSRIDEFMRPP